MSWWVNDYIAVSEDETQQLCNIQADAVSDLPAQNQTATAGFSFVRGSKAYVLDTSGQYIMNSSGQWILQKSGQEIEIGADDIIYDNKSSGMTATTVQDAIDEIHTLDDTQDRALAELYAENANQQLKIDYAINTGSKNLFPITATSQTLGGITFTVNSDGTITANGTKTNSDWFVLSENNVLEPGTYTLSDGLPDDTTDCRLIIAPTRSLNAAIMSTTTGVRTQTKTFADAQTGLYYAIRIAGGATVNNLTFKPMIRRAEITDSTYVPYAPTNRELYETTKPSYDFIFGLGTALNSNDDLNNYNKVGKVYAATGAIAATISSTPWTLSGFMVITIPYITATTFIQFLLPNTSGGKWYKRRYTTGAWSAWTEYDGTQVSAVQSVNSPMTLNLSRNDLNESLDTNFDLIDSIPEEEEGELE